MYTLQLIFCLILICNMCKLNYAIVKDLLTELELVHVIFRHGARTTYRFYPNDPHKNSTFYPVGLGGLTNEGKRGEYELGKFFRREYGHFLGEIYSEDLIYMRSTHTTRTKMSAQLVLAGMWPPMKEQRWHNELLWQPIPIDFKTKEDEDLVSPSSCIYRRMVLKDMRNWPEVQQRFIKPNKELFLYIEKHSGFPIRDVMDLLEFYFIISTENEMKLPLPKWTEAIYPEPLTSTAASVYAYWNYDEETKKINIGYLLKKILDDTFAKIEGNLQPSGRKMFMYSGHESTLGYMLDILNSTQPHIPPYGSAIIFEIRKNDKNDRFVQIKYHTDLKTTPNILIIPGCKALCPIKKFLELQEHNIPTVTYKKACSRKYVEKVLPEQ